MMHPTAAGQVLLDAFERIYVINPDRRRDRLDEVRTQLARLALSFQPNRVVRFNGCSFAEKGEFPSAGARGRFFSHLGIIREAAADRLWSILIMEDDLDFCDDIERLLARALDALGTTRWSIFYGAVLNRRPGPERWPPLSLAAAHEGKMDTHFVGMASRTLSQMDSYLSEMANRPAGSPDGGPMQVNGAYSWFRRAHPEHVTLVACPGVGHQRPSRTDIHPLSWKDTLPLVRDSHSNRAPRGQAGPASPACALRLMQKSALVGAARRATPSLGAMTIRLPLPCSSQALLGSPTDPICSLVNPYLSTLVLTETRGYAFRWTQRH